MNKDLYIELLEDRLGGITTSVEFNEAIAKKHIKMNQAIALELISVRSWNNVQDELISKIADTTLDCMDDLNDAQADMAADHADYRETLINLVEKNTRASDENVRLQGKIAELEKETVIEKELKREVFQLNKQNDDLHKQLNEAVREIAKLKPPTPVAVKEENK